MTTALDIATTTIPPCADGARFGTTTVGSFVPTAASAAGLASGILSFLTGVFVFKQGIDISTRSVPINAVPIKGSIKNYDEEEVDSEGIKEGRNLSIIGGTMMFSGTVVTAQSICLLAGAILFGSFILPLASGLAFSALSFLVIYDAIKGYREIHKYQNAFREKLQDDQLTIDLLKELLEVSSETQEDKELPNHPRTKGEAIFLRMTSLETLQEARALIKENSADADRLEILKSTILHETQKAKMHKMLSLLGGLFCLLVTITLFTSTAGVGPALIGIVATLLCIATWITIETPFIASSLTSLMARLRAAG